ncbi:transcription factor bHLH30-like [Gastrolobium bilobum]|uniref:transcription factor bHLH30-like n=1 Tax=Gastrolobium bilobum TaxID=150636 RepID=UPI002AAF5279|nr:transcription factor bHLH30-like [Gastrolobium bilobum]
MLPFRRFYGFESWLDHESSLIKATELDGGRSKTERKSTEACKSHREAERRRRQRINAHLSTLRSLLPNSAKSDKASLLAEVVQHVKRLRIQADDVARCHEGDSSSSCSSGGGGGGGRESDSVRSVADAEPWPFPGESDEATLSYCDGDDGEPRRMKATVCCEDRPGLNRDLTQAIRSVRAKAVRAEMMTVGGRTKSVVVIQWPDGGGGNARKEEEVGALERALKAVIDNRALVGSGMGPVVLGQKRARDSYDSPTSEVDCAFVSRNVD